METPYNKRDEWRIDMHRVDGTIYLNVVKLDEQVFRGQDRLMYYGYKFEELCTRGDGSASSVDANVEFCSVFKLKIGDSRVVLGAEIDCYDGEEGEGEEDDGDKDGDSGREGCGDDGANTTRRIPRSCAADVRGWLHGGRSRRRGQRRGAGIMLRF